MDDVLLLNIIVHFDALFHAHRCDLGVDVTKLSTRRGYEYDCCECPSRNYVVTRISPRVAPLGRPLRSCELILEVLLPPSNRCKQVASNNTEDCSQKLPYGHNDGDPRQNELDKLIRLVQIILAGNVVFEFAIILQIFLSCQVQYCDERDFGAVGRDGPDGKDLSEADVEDEVLLVVGDAVDFCADAW